MLSPGTPEMLPVTLLSTCLYDYLIRTQRFQMKSIRFPHLYISRSSSYTFIKSDQLFKILFIADKKKIHRSNSVREAISVINFNFCKCLRIDFI